MTLQERVQAVFEGFNHNFLKYPDRVPIVGEQYTMFPSSKSLLVELRCYRFPKDAIQALRDVGLEVNVHPHGTPIMVHEGRNIAVWKVGGTS